MLVSSFQEADGRHDSSPLPDHGRIRLPRHQPGAHLLARGAGALARHRAVRLPEKTASSDPRRHPRRRRRRAGDGRRAGRRACAAACRWQASGDRLHRRRGTRILLQRRCAAGSAACLHLVDRRLRHPGPSPDPRDDRLHASARTAAPRSRPSGYARSIGRRAVRAGAAAEELHRPERLGVFEILYEWAFEGRSFPCSRARTATSCSTWPTCAR